MNIIRKQVDTRFGTDKRTEETRNQRNCLTLKASETGRSLLRNSVFIIIWKHLISAMYLG